MLKSLTQIEVERIAKDLRELVGARLQEVYATDQVLGLGFYHSGRLQWLVFDLAAASPQVARLEAWPSHLRKRMKPVQLFLAAHLVNQRLVDVVCDRALGRVLRFQFPGGVIEIRLFPHGANVIASTPEKQISWEKPKPILRGVDSGAATSDEGRTLADISADWLSAQVESRKQKPRDIKKALEKKQKALVELTATLESREWETWRRLGEWLKANQSLKVPAEFESYVNKTLSFSETLEAVFKKAEQLEQKAEGTKARMVILQKEIALLEQGQWPETAKPKEQEEKRLLKASEAKGRTFQIGKSQLYIGKSAADNLQLLRKANPWDYWLHLRDYPGAHGILSRNRGVEVSDSEIIEAAKHIAAESRQSRTHLKVGDRFDVAVAECRFVRPIKGDKIGRVTFTNERVFRVRLEEPK